MQGSNMRYNMKLGKYSFYMTRNNTMLDIYSIDEVK